MRVLELLDIRVGSVTTCDRERLLVTAKSLRESEALHGANKLTLKSPMSTKLSNKETST